MRFPKSNIFITAFLSAILSSFAYSQSSLIHKDDNSSTSRFNTKRLNHLIKNDSLYEATILLNESIDFSKQNNLKLIEAKAYYSLGVVLTKMSNYKNAETYHLKALDIYKSMQNKEGANEVFSGLVDNYLSDKNYKKFDSIYTIAQQSAKMLNSELYFINLENRIKKNYFTKNDKLLLELTNHGIDTLQIVDIKSKNDNTAGLKTRLLKSYEYHKAIAQIKLADYKAEGFNLLFSIDEAKLKTALKDDSDGFRILSSLNYYKYRYFNEAKKNLDSANKYLLKSDTYKYAILSNIEKRNARNGELIYQIINKEQQLKLANTVRIKDAKASQALLITTILTSVLLIIAISILYFYFKAKRNIQAINKKLQSSNEKLTQTDKGRLEFLSILSHELRTPIYGITGLAALVDQENDTKKKQSYLDSLISSSNYLSTLIDNILQVNKLRLNDKALILKPGKINSIVNHVISTVEVAAKNKGLKLITNLDPSDEREHILIDKVTFSQILINLAYNAIRYTKKGTVSINVTEKYRTPNDVVLHFEVNDTGIGIKEEHRSVVFSAFENRAFLHKNSSGSGLGLHIVKTLLKSHGADIDFISTPNKGSSFFFEIKFDLVKVSTEKVPISIAPAKKQMHILVVDDNKINLLITQKNIEKIKGYSCDTISNGRQAISMVKEKHFDVILMDINMPDMDGFEVTKHIRLFNSKVPILALTALNSGEISSRAEDVGINHIITKPFMFEDFKSIIKSYAENKFHFDCMDLEAI